MVAHSALTGANLHEPKGVATASTGQVYVADGAGSGTWQKVGNSELDTSEIVNANEFYLQAVIDDISTAGNVYIPIPTACTLNKVITVLAGPITVADATITLFRLGNPINTITVAFTDSANGDIDSVVCTENNTFTEESRLRINTDGGSTDAQKVYVTAIFTKTA